MDPFSGEPEKRIYFYARKLPDIFSGKKAEYMAYWGKSY